MSRYLWYLSVPFPKKAWGYGGPHGLFKRRAEKEEEEEEVEKVEENINNMVTALRGRQTKRFTPEEMDKRQPYGFGLGKRNSYGFGLGKRSPTNWLQTRYGFGKRAPYGFGLGK